MVGLFDYDNDNVPGFSVTTSVLIAPGRPRNPSSIISWNVQGQESSSRPPPRHSALDLETTKGT
ncbi:hypothetical protein [uncultured Thiodictyon sp.]|uniref:hypothetical protein n=1 Tax=uncultured Thiodictyon sp. TaxID=1846217 RepID=UPI0025CD72B5|nr:hypothetical protein [uncultured Thiodictyon sp.]